MKDTVKLLCYEFEITFAEFSFKTIAILACSVIPIDV